MGRYKKARPVMIYRNDATVCFWHKYAFDRHARWNAANQ